MIAIRTFFYGVWFLISSLIGVVYLFACWGSSNLDRMLARTLAWGGLPLMGIKLKVENEDKLYIGRPVIYIGNHQTNLDLITYGSIYPKHTITIGKREILWIPIFGLLFKYYGNILLNRQNRTEAVLGLKDAMHALQKEGKSIWIFPEGTRNRTGRSEMLPFKKGAFHMAIQAQVPLLPLVCTPVRRPVTGRLTIRVLPPIETQGLTLADMPVLIEKTRAIMHAEIQKLERERDA